LSSNASTTSAQCAGEAFESIQPIRGSVTGAALAKGAKNQLRCPVAVGYATQFELKPAAAVDIPHPQEQRAHQHAEISSAYCTVRPAQHKQSDFDGRIIIQPATEGHVHGSTLGTVRILPAGHKCLANQSSCSGGILLEVGNDDANTSAGIFLEF
jgi:hypothetical protein